MIRQCTIILAMLMAHLAIFGQSSREIRKFDSGWKFTRGDVYRASEPGFADVGWQDVNLPHDWSIDLEFDPKMASCTAYLPGGIGWYRKSFDVPESMKGKVVTILFDGVYNNSEVWINGHYLGIRPYGYISFGYNLTPFLEYGKKNVISVRVDHSESADTRWYSGSGIYRHVWLTITSPLHVARWGTFVSTPQVSKERAVISIKTSVANGGGVKGPVKVVSEIWSRDGMKVASTENEVTLHDSLTAVAQEISLAGPELWDTGNPYLYTVKTTVTDGRQKDQTETPFGIRTLRFDPDSGFFLNGRNTKLKGVCLHHDGGCVGAAVPEKIWKIRLEKLKAAGCNAIRTSHNPVAPEFLDLCDRMGFLVMDEAFDEWEYPKRKWIDGWNQSIAGQQGYSRYFNQWAVPDLTDMIERDKNHPSVIMWSIGNEIDYANDPYADQRSEQGQAHQGVSAYRPDAERMIGIGTRLRDAIKRIDTTRPVTMALANIGNSRRIRLPEILDIVGYNYTEGRYASDHKKYPSQFIYGSENPHNYDGWLAVRDNSYISSQFLWTGVDYLGEAGKFPVRSAYSGLLDLTGREKPIYYWRQSMWSEKPMIYLTARKKSANDRPDLDPMGKLAWFVNEIPERQHWNYRPGDTLLLVAFTNCRGAELFINGKSFGKKKSDPAHSSIWWYIPYEAGEVKVVADNPGGEKLQSALQTESAPAAISIGTDSQLIKADGQDVAVVEVSFRDKDGRTAYLADNRVDFDVTGPGRVIGTDNGDAAFQYLVQYALRYRQSWLGL